MNEQEAKDIVASHGPTCQGGPCGSPENREEQRCHYAQGFLEAHTAAKEREAKLREEMADNVWQITRWKQEESLWKEVEADLKADNARLRAVVERVRDYISGQLVDSKLREGIEALEDATIRELCERIGYGAVMDSAARQWRSKDPIGAFIIGGCIGTFERLLAESADALGKGEALGEVAKRYYDEKIAQFEAGLKDGEGKRKE